MNKKLFLAILAPLMLLLAATLVSAEHRVVYSDPIHYPSYHHGHDYYSHSVSYDYYDDSPRVRVRTYYSNSPLATGKYSDVRYGRAVYSSYRAYPSYSHYEYIPATYTGSYAYKHRPVEYQGHGKVYRVHDYYPIRVHRYY